MNESLVLLDVLKVFGLSAFSFFVAFFSTPLLTHYLYKYKMWDSRGEREALSGGRASVIGNIIKERSGAHTPRMGGILIWGTTLAVTFIFWLLASIYDSALFTKLNFLSRNQTWLPVAALAAGSLVGFLDDWMLVRHRGGYVGGGLELTKRIAVVIVMGAVGAFWFYGPLQTDSIIVPFVGEIQLGLFFIPLFIFTMLAVFSSGVIDGLDGLAGGVFASIIAAYGGIAYFQRQLDLAAFLAVMGGALLAFLWYNIPPARFYMGETGILGLTSMLTVVAFLTKAVVVLPIIAFPLVIETGSVIIQVASKKFRGKKVFLAAPIHHHFEAKGWPHYKVTMRFWVVGLVSALVGLVIHIVGMK
jgi:phospho-N-acetylmuramoyl-pentapeptide-transferase